MIAITVKYLGPTNTKGTRLKAFANGNSITISKDYALSDKALALSAAQALCKKMNWPGHLIHGGTQETDVFVFLKSDYELTKIIELAMDFIATGIEKDAYRDTLGHNTAPEKIIGALEDLIK